MISVWSAIPRSKQSADVLGEDDRRALGDGGDTKSVSARQPEQPSANDDAYADPYEKLPNAAYWPE